MKRLHTWLRDYFGFTRSESRGFVALLMLMLFALAALALAQWWGNGKSVPISPAEQARFRELLAQLPDDTLSLNLSESDFRTPRYTRKAYTRRPTIEIATKPFAFDPNTASEEVLTRLGLKPYLVERIVKYREKGGKFRNPEDVKKIYGLPAALYEQLAPYIKINTLAQDPPLASSVEDTQRSTKKLDKRLSTFDLNHADTTTLKQVRGIGSKLATRIIEYRQKLGGFATLDQLREVYGIQAETIDELLKYAQISPNPTLRPLNLNTATQEELQAHPYLKRRLAQAIVHYRTQHGAFRTTSDLEKIKIITPQDLQKLAPYLKW